MLSGAIDGRLSRYPMFHQVCSLTVQNKTGTGILKLGESFCDGLRHTEGSSWYLKKEKREMLRVEEDRRSTSAYPAHIKRSANPSGASPRHHFFFTPPLHFFAAKDHWCSACVTLWRPPISSSILAIVTPGLFCSHQQR